jgi:hypothetical protein
MLTKAQSDLGNLGEVDDDSVEKGKGKIIAES